jgi:hypothetical protein
VLVSFLLCAFKGGLQTLLDELFATLDASGVRAVTKSAVSQARQKLKATVFEALNERLLCSLAALQPEPRWRGLRLVATDSTTLRLPNWPENQEEFGVQHDTAGQPYVLARALGLYATDARLMLKATLAPYLTGERALLATLLPHLDTDDLLLMDRGFPAVWLFTLLQQRGLPFLARLDGTQWPCVADFLRSGQADTLVTRRVSAEARKQAAAAGQTLTNKTLTFRLLKVVLPNGAVEVLATSLTDAETYPAVAFADLYHARWTIEEAFKLLKHRLHLEQFTGELPESIRQDFHAKVFTANLAQALARATHEALPEEKAQRYRPNLTHLLQSLKPRLFAWLIQRVSPEQVLTLLELAGNTLELRRPGRSASRPLHRVSPRPRRQYK